MRARKTKLSDAYVVCGKKEVLIAFRANTPDNFFQFMRKLDRSYPNPRYNTSHSMLLHEMTFENMTKHLSKYGPCYHCKANYERGEEAKRKRNADRAWIVENGYTLPQFVNLLWHENKSEEISKKHGMEMHKLWDIGQTARHSHLEELDSKQADPPLRCSHPQYAFSVTSRGKYYFTRKGPEHWQDDVPPEREVPGPHYSWWTKAVKPLITL